MKKIGLIGCATSNLGSVTHAINHLGYDPVVVYEKQQITKCSHLILPGVGSFQSGMSHLIKHDLLEAIKQAYEQGLPILGICLGMQLFSFESEEFGKHEGLKLIPSKVEKIKPNNGSAKLPHVGWSIVSYLERSLLFKNLEPDASFYFTHSYAISGCNEAYITSTVDYHGYQIVASVERDNLFGVQFHPEKSQHQGLLLIKNFINI